jgi:uncharacterized protein (DUF58 family)
MLTPRGIAVCALAGLAWVLGRFLGVDELYVVSGACIALVVLAIISTRLSSAHIAVRRATGTQHAGRGDRVPIDLSLRNDGRLPASLLLIEDGRPSGVVVDEAQGGMPARFVVRGLRPRRVVDLRWHAVGVRRGRFAVGPLRIRLRDPFGLAERSRRYRGTDDLVVFPTVEPLTPGAGDGTHQGEDATAVRRAFYRGDEFHTMRPYVVGDDLRHVHWPSTAHRGTLMVRQHELPWQARAIVHVDTREHVHRGAADRGTLERAVSAAASVLVHLQRGHDEVHLVTAGAAPPTPDARGPLLDAELVRLAELTTTRERSPLAVLQAVQRAGTGLLVTIVRPPEGDDGLAEHPEVQALLRAGRGYRARIALIIEHHDHDRCTTLATLLRLAGWQAAVAVPDVPLAEAWRRATVGGLLGHVAGARA